MPKGGGRPGSAFLVEGRALGKAEEKEHWMRPGNEGPSMPAHRSGHHRMVLRRTLMDELCQRQRGPEKRALVLHHGASSVLLASGLYP